MKKRIVAVMAVLGTLAAAPVAHAEATRTWVSGLGDDANPCSRTAPCKTWAGAISKTAPGGEIDALDPGGFGAVTITKAMTLKGRGTHASILNPSATGIAVNAGTNDVVNIVDLQIQGAGSGLNGINFIAGKALHVRNTLILGQGTGINVAANSPVTIDHSAFSDSTYGLANHGSGKITVTNSAFDNITNNGISSFGNGGVITLRNVSVTGAGVVGAQAALGGRLSLEQCLITANNVGVWSDGATSLVRVSNSEIVENNTGLQSTNSGPLLSRQNNTVQDNASNGSFTGTFGPS